MIHGMIRDASLRTNRPNKALQLGNRTGCFIRHTGGDAESQSVTGPNSVQYILADVGAQLVTWIIPVSSSIIL